MPCWSLYTSVVARMSAAKIRDSCDTKTAPHVPPLSRGSYGLRLLRNRRRHSRQLVIHSTSAVFTASGCSMVERCPQSGTMTSHDPAMPSASSRESAGGVSSSPSPTSTSVGHLIVANSGRPRHDRSLLPQENLRSGFLGHDAHARSQRGVALPVAMHEERKLQRRNLGEAAALGERDLRLATRGLLRGFRPRRGVEQRELLHAFGRLPHARQGEIAHHHNAPDRKT